MGRGRSRRTARSGIASAALGVIRVVNGSTALLAPKLLMRRADAAANRAAVYGLRLYGVRTLLIGLELLSSDRVVRDRAVRLALADPRQRHGRRGCRGSAG